MPAQQHPTDIVLLGTEAQVGLAAHAARELVAGRHVHTHELVVSLRDFIRQALDLEPIPTGLEIPMQGTARLGGGGSRERERGKGISTEPFHVWPRRGDERASGFGLSCQDLTTTPFPRNWLRGVKILNAYSMAGILFFDIRNFSSHRQFLADHSKASLLTKLIQSLLNEASELSGICNQICKLKKQPWMNHTGDGFILIFATDRGSLAALRFASVFRQLVKALFDEYTSNLKQLFPTHPLQDIDWGMGLHDGGAIEFTYKDVNKEEKVGYIGSALNWASRVEAATKDHTFHVICTQKVRVLFMRALGRVQPDSVSKYFSSLGRHRLRGLPTPIELYGCKSDIHLFIDKVMAASE